MDEPLRRDEAGLYVNDQQAWRMFRLRMDPIIVVNKMTIGAGELPYGGKIDNLLTVSV
ncbi:hypothetical protein KVG88_10505 [Pseudomonas sp. SWRI74]|jgi:hypothetical protein|uniref:Uncharacterized protein n=1 Tax=Pseudomonas azerbaijanoccidentalis TaxID=2842347 RepID=A0ABS6QNI8_9PSED|nr:hypothetical protein [Pseudomonas azerbaijanoccidentalis]MBV4520494.1 hypothetical protein [Pseudomonas azerbaijanoccidentalis]